MKLALFDDNRLGIVTSGGSGDQIVDVTAALPGTHGAEPLTAGWWRALCPDSEQLRPTLERAAADGFECPINAVTLRALALSQSKIIAAASNYREHVAEMHDVQERTLGRVGAWMTEFDIFLKAPTATRGTAAGMMGCPSQPDALTPRRCAAPRDHGRSRSARRACHLYDLASEHLEAFENEKEYGE